jgi:hypothetical protein
VRQQEEFQSVAENEICTEVHDLARSTDTDKLQNTFGLDENVLLRIFSLLDARDIGRASQTCKTWRRICLTERLWKGVADSLGIACKEDENCRSKTIEHVDSYIQPDFAYLPDDLKEEQTIYSSAGLEEIRVVVLALLGLDSGPGKTSLVERFTNDLFMNEYGKFFWWTESTFCLICFLFL